MKTPRTALRPLAARATLFTLLWVVLTGAEPYNPFLALLTIAAATWVSLRLLPGRPRPWRPVPVLRFILFFLREGLSGGFDVARRAWNPSLPVRPALVRLRLRLRAEPDRVLAALVMNLLPGTLSTRLEENRLSVHVIDDRLDVAGTLRRLEDRIEEAFGPVEHAPTHAGERNP